MIEVYANGRKFSGWTAAQVSRSVERIAAVFSLDLVSRDSSGSPVKLFPGDPVEVAVNGTTVVSGFVDKLSSSFGNGTHTIRVSGAESTSDLADCGIDSKKEWSGKTIDAIIDDVCADFGLGFSNSMSVDVGKPFDKFSADPGTKALDSIAKLCKERGILPVSDGLGTISLLKPERCKRGGALVQGKNVVAASVDVSMQNRYSSYTVYGTGKAKKRVEGCATDSEVFRKRPFVLVDSNAVEKESVQSRADFERQIRKAKSTVVRVTVHGWESSKGIWSPGLICSFCAPDLFVQNPIDLLVSSVDFIWNGSGELTNLTLVSPESYTPQPEVKKKKGVKTSRSSSSPWDAIRKAVKGK